MGSHGEAKRFTIRILAAMGLSVVFGLMMQFLALPDSVTQSLLTVLEVGGTLFITLLKMLVVPVVFVSLVCGVSQLGDLKQLGRIGSKSIGLYVLTTMIAVSIAIFFASLFHVGVGVGTVPLEKEVAIAPLSIADIFLNIFPSNPIEALASGDMLQIVFLALLLGASITMSGSAGQRVAKGFQSFNEVVMRIVVWVMQLAPIGVFCLLGRHIAHAGVGSLLGLLYYFMVVLLILSLQLFGVYSLFLWVFARINPVAFFKKAYAAMIFAFSVSSSAASIPVVLETVESRLGVDNKVASFVIPVGATINMDGTAIMQGVATVFIANAFSIHLGFSAYLSVVALATLASIGTAGVPGVGMVTLAMVLQHVGLPVEGIAMVLGVDRILDMVRTGVNVGGDMMVSCVVASSEGCLDREVAFPLTEAR